MTRKESKKRYQIPPFLSYQTALLSRLHNSYLAQIQHEPTTNRGVVDAIKEYALSAYNKLPHWEKDVKKVSSLTSFSEQVGQVFACESSVINISKSELSLL